MKHKKQKSFFYDTFIKYLLFDRYVLLRQFREKIHIKNVTK